MSIKLKIKKGDEVIVITGRDKGKKGKVLAAIPKDGKLVVAGVNSVKRHTKPGMGTSGGIVVKELPIDISNVAIVDPKTGEPSKVGFKNLADGRKVRFVKKSGEVIDN